MTNSDKITIANVVATVLAVLLAPIVALWVNGKVQRRAGERADKVRILGVLLSLRHQPLSADAIRSLNLIDVVFATDSPSGRLGRGTSRPWPTKTWERRRAPRSERRSGVI